MSSVTSSLPIGSPNSTANANPYGELSTDEFMEILLTELEYQDPLEPNDSAALLEQMSSIRSIQSDIELGDQLSAVVAQNEFASAGLLIGQKIEGIDQQGHQVQGIVTSVSRTDDGPVLKLTNGERVAFADVQNIFQADTQTETLA